MLYKLWDYRFKSLIAYIYERSVHRILQGYAPLDLIHCALKLWRSLSCLVDENRNIKARIIDGVWKAMPNCKTSQLKSNPKN